LKTCSYQRFVFFTGALQQYDLRVGKREMCWTRV